MDTYEGRYDGYDDGKVRSSIVALRAKKRIVR